MLTHVITAATLASLFLLALAVALDHPLVTKADLQRWVQRTGPARLLRGHTRARRRAVGLLLAAAGLALVAGIADILAGNRFWVWVIGSEVFVVSLICLDISQHRRDTGRTITGAGTTTHEGGPT